MTFVKDIAWLLLIGLLMPLWMLLAVGSVVVIVGGHLYMWARGNTTAVSRPSRRPRWSWNLRRRSSLPGGGPSSYREASSGPLLQAPREPTPAVRT
jgi:hypothetical protein